MQAHSAFAELGGDSLAALRVCRALAAAWQTVSGSGSGSGSEEGGRERESDRDGPRAPAPPGERRGGKRVSSAARGDDAKEKTTAKKQDIPGSGSEGPARPPVIAHTRKPPLIRARVGG
jgi:hypothetical protein